MDSGQLACQVQPKPKSEIRSRRLLVRREDAVELIHSQAGALVVDRQDGFGHATGSVLDTQADLNGAARGVLHRVFQQVRQDLPQP